MFEYRFIDVQTLFFLCVRVEELNTFVFPSSRPNFTFSFFQNGFFVFRIINESGHFYIYREYATDDEPLYAKAIELITGKNPSIGIRSVEDKIVKGNVRKMPSIFRPGHDGMLKRYASKDSPNYGK